ncbi:GNAT family N-acetyltransferase [Dokdonella koreensis]|uniref:Sortase n=1 Tax=Dokdonella koreensis DS-123 TaxID=1300342 RepID=A0A160DVL4_9GAMM|nr:GNAT family N-acetyltransferase [Dokdonella koreensis]ANB18589.1 Sortase [Dokdonella koreensis DS-123]
MNDYLSAIRPPAARASPLAPPAAGERFVTRDGREVRIRPIHPGDVAALRRAFARLTPDQVHQRVFHAMNELPERIATWMCNVDPQQTHAIVATDPDGSEIRGEARIHCDYAAAAAEFAIAIDPSWTGVGLGQALMDRLIAEARSRGMTEIWGDVLADNGAMIDLVARLGFQRQRRADDATVVRAWRLLD